MRTRPDLATEDDVADLVRRFYGDVTQDVHLGHLFNEVAQVDWSGHWPDRRCLAL